MTINLSEKGSPSIMKGTRDFLEQNNNLNFDNITSKGLIKKGNCITGNKDHFVNYLREAFKRAKSIDIIVAFKGIRLLY